MRKIEKKMYNWIDAKLKDNGVAQHAIVNRDARLLLVCAAQACVGVREEGGNNRGEIVELIQETIGSAAAEPWCMSLVQTLIAYVENRFHIVSPVFATEHVQTCWNKTDQDQRIRFYPLPGAIIIWRKGSSSSGHTGIVYATDGDVMWALEGNTEKGLEDGKVVRDGGGVYLVKRNIRGTGNMMVRGFLKPFQA